MYIRDIHSKLYTCILLAILLTSKYKMNFQAYTLSTHPEWACIQVKAPESENRTPIHLCCVIDTSASMTTFNKLENVKQSLQFLLDFLGPQDHVSIITFSEAAKTILNQIAITASEKDNIRTRISFIRAESNTNLSAGIVQSRESLMIDSSNCKQGILLLTDGNANLGLTRPSDIIDLVRNTINKFNGTSISSVGYGTDHNVELLQNISTEGGGSYYVVNNLEDVATVFGDVLGGLVSCSSQQVCISLPIGSEIKSRYATNTTGDVMDIIIGDMPAGSEAAFLAKIPSGLSLSLKGYDLQTHNSFEVTTQVITTDDSDLQTNGLAHYLRFEVMMLLEQSRNLFTRFAPVADVTSQLDKIKECIGKITQYRTMHEHTLWDILLEELNTCKKNLENRNTVAMDTPHIMTQHAGYLGRMRGLPAATQDPNGIPTPLPVGRTFSNYAQRQISSQLCATVSGGLPRQDASQDPLSVPVLPVPLVHMSNVNSFPNIMRTYASSGPLGESLNDPSHPLMTPLVRHVACSTSDSNSENTE